MQAKWGHLPFGEENTTPKNPRRGIRMDCGASRVRQRPRVATIARAKRERAGKRFLCIVLCIAFVSSLCIA